METTSSTAIPTTGASLTSGPVYTDAREALTEAPIRAAAPLKSPKCILFRALRVFKGECRGKGHISHLSLVLSKEEKETSKSIYLEEESEPCPVGACQETRLYARLIHFYPYFKPFDVLKLFSL